VDAGDDFAAVALDVGHERDSELVREDTLLDEIPDRLRMGERTTLLVVRHIPEGVEAEGQGDVNDVPSLLVSQ
jgi:hypothetical protein